jgi:hypothetical protein
MAERVSELLEDAGRRRRLGDAARQKVLRRHDVSVAAPQIERIIRATLRPSPGVGRNGAASDSP